TRPEIASRSGSKSQAATSFQAQRERGFRNLPSARTNPLRSKGTEDRTILAGVLAARIRGCRFGDEGKAMHTPRWLRVRNLERQAILALLDRKSTRLNSS